MEFIEAITKLINKECKAIKRKDLKSKIIYVDKNTIVMAKVRIENGRIYYSQQTPAVFTGDNIYSKEWVLIDEVTRPVEAIPMVEPASDVETAPIAEVEAVAEVSEEVEVESPIVKPTRKGRPPKSRL